MTLSVNPTMSELGKLSKHILQTINTELQNTIKVNQWQSLNEVIEWFKDIPNKKWRTFTVFDIQEFNPSITENLLKQEIWFIQNSVSIPPKSTDIIFHSRKYLLYHNDDPWVKKDTSAEIEVTMSSYDGAEVCQIVWLLMLDILNKLFEKNSIGFCRDDGVSCYRNYNGHQSDKVIILDILIKLSYKMWSQKCRLFRHIIRLEQQYLQTLQQTQEQVIIHWCKFKSSAICAITDFQICIKKHHR